MLDNSEKHYVNTKLLILGEYTRTRLTLYARALADQGVFHHLLDRNVEAVTGLEKAIKVYDRAFQVTGDQER
jgi:hypothetical protein